MEFNLIIAGVIVGIILILGINAVCSAIIALIITVVMRMFYGQRRERRLNDLRDEMDELERKVRKVDMAEKSSRGVAARIQKQENLQNTIDQASAMIMDENIPKEVKIKMLAAHGLTNLDSVASAVNKFATGLKKLGIK